MWSAHQHTPRRPMGDAHKHHLHIFIAPKALNQSSFLKSFGWPHPRICPGPLASVIMQHRRCFTQMIDIVVAGDLSPAANWYHDVVFKCTPKYVEINCTSYNDPLTAYAWGHTTKCDPNQPSPKVHFQAFCISKIINSYERMCTGCNSWVTSLLWDCLLTFDMNTCVNSSFKIQLLYLSWGFENHRHGEHANQAKKKWCIWLIPKQKFGEKWKSFKS